MKRSITSTPKRKVGSSCFSGKVQEVAEEGAEGCGRATDEIERRRRSGQEGLWDEVEVVGHGERGAQRQSKSRAGTQKGAEEAKIKSCRQRRGAVGGHDRGDVEGRGPVLLRWCCQRVDGRSHPGCRGCRSEGLG